MHPISLLLLLLPLVCLADSAKPVPARTVDMDAPAFERWRQIATEFGPLVRLMVRGAVGKQAPAPLALLVRLLGRPVHQLLDEPYRTEVAGFAHYANISVGELAAFQFIYDINTYCTGIVCVDANNTIWHARNFDKGDSRPERRLLKRLTLTVHFVRGGKRRLSATILTGFLGFHSAMRLGGFSVNLNTRWNGSLGANVAAAVKMAAKTGHLRPVGFVIRAVAETAPNFDRAVRWLASAPLIAPGYIIVGGLSGNQGAVITRGRASAVDVYRPDVAAGRWYVLQTNYDRWLSPPADDDRRGPAKAAMKRMGRANIAPDALFKVLFTPPVRNEETILSMVMSASHSVYQAVYP